jgi:two-component system, cell cycle sensor histidine kinase and response regulator CckA
MDAKLHKVERWLSTTLSSIGDAVIATDRHGRVSLVNAVAQRLTGWTEEEALGRPFNEVLRVIDGGTREPILDLIDRALLDGFSIGVDENVLLQPCSGVELPVDDSIAPIRDESDQVTGVVIVFRDGTERRFAEQANLALHRQLEDRVRERTAELQAANRALAAFSGSVSHDLRAPLRAVSGCSDMLSARYADVLDVEGRRFLQIIQAKSAQMTRMIDDFLRLSRLRHAPLRVAPLDVDAIVREVVADLAQENVAANGIVIDPLPGFEGDEGLIRQVWVNVLGNALKFTAKREQPSHSGHRGRIGRHGAFPCGRRRRGFRHGLCGPAVRAVPAFALRARLRGQRHRPCDGRWRDRAPRGPRARRRQDRRRGDLSFLRAQKTSRGTSEGR